MNSALMLHRHASPAVAGSYSAGAVSGALVTGSALLLLNGLVSPIPNQWLGVAAVLVLSLLLLRVTGVLCLDLPQRKVQIPRETFTSSPTQAAFRFAFELGTGVRTYITTSAPYALAVALVCCLPSGLGAAAGSATLAAVGYGLGRSVIVASQSLRHRVSVESPAVWLRAADFVAVTAALGLAIVSLASR